MSWCGIGLAVAAIILILAIAARVRRTRIKSSQAGALAALDHLAEWTKWMTGLEVAALTGLSYLTLGEDPLLEPGTGLPGLFATASFVLLGAGLIVAGWSMSALPSLALRAHGDVVPAGGQAHVDLKFDVLEESIYATWQKPSLGFVYTVHHWLWGTGLVCLGLFLATSTLGA